jgi:DNA-binding NarL/FixJ family response regulator
MSKTRAVTWHVLSIRDNPLDEQLIETIWGSDPEIEISHVLCGVDGLAYLQTEDRKIPNLILLAWRFQENQMSAAETLAALKADGALRPVPVIVLAGRLTPFQIQELYANQVSCVFEMPTAVGALEVVLRTLKDLWLNSARLPYEQPSYQSEVSLTDREREIVRLTAEDLTEKEIGFRLGISAKTVEFHRQSIRKRLGVEGIAGIIRYAIRNGLIEA